MEMNFQYNQINSHYIQHISKQVFLGKKDHWCNPVILDPKGALFIIMGSSGSQPFGLEEVKGRGWRAREEWESRAAVPSAGNSSCQLVS